jgi:hypothetical protein
MNEEQKRLIDRYVCERKRLCIPAKLIAICAGKPNRNIFYCKVEKYHYPMSKNTQMAYDKVINMVKRLISEHGVYEKREK